MSNNKTPIAYRLPHGGTEDIVPNRVLGSVAILRWCFSWHLVHVATGLKVWENGDKTLVTRLGKRLQTVKGLGAKCPSANVLSEVKSIVNMATGQYRPS